MMKFCKIPLMLLTGLAMIAPLSVSAADVALFDNSFLLTTDEYNDSVDRLYSATDETGHNIGLYLSNAPMTDAEAIAEAKKSYEAVFPAGSDGIFCCIDATSEDGGFGMYTSGSAGLYYLSSERSDMIRNDLSLFLYPPDTEDAVGAVNMYAINLEYWHNEGPAEHLAVYDDVNKLYYYAENGEILSSSEPPPQLPPVETEISSEAVTSEEETTEDTTAPKSSSKYVGNVLLHDESGRLTAEEYAQCAVLLNEASEYTGMNVGMVIGSVQRSEYTIESIAVETYDQMFGETTDGLLYYMDLSNAERPYDYITTCGMGQFYYTNSVEDNRIDAIFDAVFPYLYPKGMEDVPGAVEEFAEQVKEWYDAGIPDNYYVYDDYYEEYYYVENGEILSSYNVPYVDWEELFMIGVVCLVVGHIVAMIVFLCTKAHYKFKSSLSPTAYINRKNLVFHNQYDRFVREHTTRTKIESSSGGGGGRRSGGGRSSGGHGGGGRHR